MHSVFVCRTKKSVGTLNVFYSIHLILESVSKNLGLRILVETGECEELDLIDFSSVPAFCSHGHQILFFSFFTRYRIIRPYCTFDSNLPCEMNVNSSSKT